MSYLLSAKPRALYCVQRARSGSRAEGSAGTTSSTRAKSPSTGASGSGLWWVVFGGIAVDGQLGLSGIVTNGTDELRFVGGILVEPKPLGGL